MKRVLFIAVVFLAGLTVAAQTPTTLRMDVRLVNVVATVTDADGKFVPNLSAGDFTVLEDGVPQKISHFTQDRDIPVSVGIVLDTSASMTPKMRTATDAVDRFINDIHADDDIFLMTFARSIVVEQDFTNDRRKLSRAMNSLHIGGGTVLYDALVEAIEKVKTGRHDKRAILMITDGMDAGSRRATLETALRAIRGAEVLIYGLGTAQTLYADPAEHVPFTLPTPSSTSRGPATIVNSRTPPARRGGGGSIYGVNMTVLNQFATNSGGQSFLLASTFIDSGESEIDRALGMIADELRSQYTLGYYPPKADTEDAGTYRTIRVATRKGLTVRARTGYQVLP
jgi:Ca-activated chloride channel family protein